MALLEQWQKIAYNEKTERGITEILAEIFPFGKRRI